MSVLPFVRGVDFSRNQFERDQFVETVSEMSNLRWLRLNRSQLCSLPDEIDRFQKLEVLTIAHNKMTALHSGNLPALSSLRVVNVAHNNLRDSGLPSELFTLKELHTLDMSHNNLSKVPEELLKSKNLIVVNLSHNKISAIPGALFVQLTGVEYIDLSHNELQSLPPQLRRMEHLKNLNLSHNPLQHYTFKVLDKLTQLTTLNLSNTGRDFTNTPNIDKLMNLADIDLSYNDLTRIPESVYLVESLTRVNMSHNQVKELSSLIDTWQKLVTLDLSHNMITALHPNICKCSKMKRLFLNDNRLKFEGIPAAIGKLTSLEHFVAARNKLECVPEGLCHCYSLKSLILTSNCLLTLPEGVHFLKLEKLDIRDNPDLTMPPKPVQQVKGSGAEWYNIDFDPEILKKGAVVSAAQVIKGTYTKQKERREKMMKSRKISTTTLRGSSRDEKDAEKVLKGLMDVAEATAGSRDYDVLAVGAGVTMGTERDREREPERQKRWDALLKRPDLDYSDLFSETTGKLPGLAVWQIENFYPVEIDDSQHGQFYKGDSYIVLKTEWDDNSELTWEIYFWVGEDSTMDKKACAAMHSVHLRNMLGSERRTHREELGDESDEFIDLFTEITYIEGGSQSGFFTVEEEDVVYRLYQLHGSKNPFLEPVETVAESLDLGQVFLLDCGNHLFVWSGNKSSLMSRSKARLLAEKINKFERKNKSRIVQIRPGQEPDEFWKFLGGEPEDPIPLREHTYIPRRSILYRVGLGTGYLELPQVELPLGNLQRPILKSNDVYILDCHTDIFVWIGRRSPRLVRAAALRMADELQKMLARPSTALVTRCQEGTEPVIFKTRFIGWEDVLSVDFTRTSEMVEKRKVELKKNPGQDPDKKAAKVDMSPLFLERQPPMANRVANELQLQYNHQLVSIRCCIIEGRKFSILPNKEKGHFYSAECYFFLCRYVEEKEREHEHGGGDEEESGEEGEEGEDEEEEEMQTVVYFWQGRNASNMGWLHFTLGIQKQLEQAIEGPIDVIHLKQQQEDFRFLAHFGGKFIIHWGKRNPEVTSYQPSLYQIRANQSKICRRVVQVPAEPRSLNSAFCHVLKVPFETGGTGIVYIWIGSQATQEEAIHAEQMGRSMFDSTFSNVLVQEGSEPENFFWVALGGRKEYETNADFLKYSRLFRCSNEKGFFAVSEKCSDFCQGDLSNQDVMLLDTGKQVCIWFGADATDIEKKLAVKSVQVYIKHLQEQEGAVKRKLKLAKRGSEPWEFTRCFHGWVSSSST